MTSDTFSGCFHTIIWILNGGWVWRLKQAVFQVFVKEIASHSKTFVIIREPYFYQIWHDYIYIITALFCVTFWGIWKSKIVSLLFKWKRKMETSLVFVLIMQAIQHGDGDSALILPWCLLVYKNQYSISLIKCSPISCVKIALSKAMGTCILPSFSKSFC